VVFDDIVALGNHLTVDNCLDASISVPPRESPAHDSGKLRSRRRDPVRPRN
jgi:hypothetical protein